MAIKKSRGGKHGKLNPDKAGSPKKLRRAKKFVFYSETKGYLTLYAESWKEAWRIAKARGYKYRVYRR